MPARARHRRHLLGRLSLGSLVVVRLLLIANACILLAIGALYLVYGSGGRGKAAGGTLVAGALLLLSCIPLTDPYRAAGRRRHRR
jgi:hypothetical protein